MTTEKPLKIDLWSDYVCPYCYLQLPVLEQLQALYGQHLEVRWHAFELRPAPIETPDPQAAHLRMAWSNSVLPLADRRKLVMKIPKVQPRSRKALEAAVFAKTQGRFETFNRQAFRAFFELGQDIGDTDTLLQLARDSGMDPEALHHALDEHCHTQSVQNDENLADELGLRAVPTLLLRRADQPLREARVLNGTLPLERLREAVEGFN